MKRLICIVGFISFLGQAKAADPVKNPKIEKVTVYLRGAQVERTTTVSVVEGKNTFLFEGLSPLIDEKSIHISGLGTASVAAISLTTNALKKKETSEKLILLQEDFDALKKQRNTQESMLKGLEQEQLLYSSNQQINGSNASLSLAQIKEIATYYRQRMEHIEQKKYEIRRSLETLERKIIDSTTEIEKLKVNTEEERGEIKLKINADHTGVLYVRLRYVVSQVGWFSNYDLKAASINTPLTLDYKATIYQQSGVDWKNVQMVLSTGDPNTNTKKPEVVPKYLNFVYNPYRRNEVQRSFAYKYNPLIRRVTGIITDESGSPLPGVNIIEKGTANGTQTDFDGAYSLDIKQGSALVYSYVGFSSQEIPIYSNQMNVGLKGDASALEEVVVVGYGTKRGGRYRNTIKKENKPEPVNEQVQEVEEGLLSTSFVLTEHYSIPSSEETVQVQINRFKIPAEFAYYAAPEFSENVFLTATIRDWEKLDLLSGDAKIYFEGSYAGNTFIDPNAVTDSLTVSLGADPNIVIKRESLNDHKRTSFTGNTRIIEKAYELVVKNTKSKKITLTLEDRIPVSQNKEIKIDDIEVYDADYNDKKGIVSWKLTLAPNQQEKKKFSYRLKYPRGNRVNL